MPKPILKKPAGPSELDRGYGIEWDRLRIGTLRAVLCEICGKKHPKLDEKGEKHYTFDLFLGRQVIEECCGAIIDQAYRELGEVFVLAFLAEFAENPSDDRFKFFLRQLKKALKRAEIIKLAEASKTVAEISEAVRPIT